MQPKILCLHGGGTSAQIFNLQARKLVQLLKPHFDLVFPDGFLECDAGPGVLPIFKGCEPFRQWLHDTPGGPEPEEADWSSGVGRLAEDVLDRQGPFVGVIGFSQGAKAAMHLLRFLEKREVTEGVLNPVRFAVLVCGTVPFQGVKGPHDARVQAHKESLGLGTVKTPSIHAIADDDPWRPESEALVEFFDGQSRRLVVRFRGGHYMPKDDAVNGTIVDFIQEEYDGM